MHNSYLESIPLPAEVSPSNPPPAFRFPMSGVSPCELLLKTNGLHGFEPFDLYDCVLSLTQSRLGATFAVGLVSVSK